MVTQASKLMAGLLAAGFLATSIALPADARRGGSFGSRGSRTYSAPRSTRLATGYTPGLSRSMTPRSTFGSAPSQYGPSYGSGYGQRTRPRFGFGSGLLAGVVAGGLVGSLLGHGMGGYGGYAGAGAGGGMLALLIQLAIIGGIIWLAVRLFRGQRQAAPGAPPMRFERPMPFGDTGPGPRSSAISASVQGGDISLTSADQQAFETLLIDLQDAFGQEDYGRLRAITTPEIMSYLAEELSDNATHGRRNDVTGIRLIDAEVSEAWQEAGADYATIAMRYESIDITRDRATGLVLTGDPVRPSQATEIWTFVRPTGAWSSWKVSAIQEA